MFHYLKYFLFHGIGLLAAAAMFLGDGWIIYGLATIFGGYILLDAILGDDDSTPTFKHPQILTVQLWLALPLAEGQQPATDEHGDRVPGAVRQLVSSDGTDHADHQTSDNHRADFSGDATGFFRRQNIQASQRLHGRTNTQNIT